MRSTWWRSQGNIPLHFTNPLRRLLLIHDLPFCSLFPCTLLVLMPKLGFLNLHPCGCITQPKFGLVHQVHRECDGVLLEEDDEGFSNKCPIVSSVHLDLGFTSIIFLYHPAFAEPLDELVDLRIVR